MMGMIFRALILAFIVGIAVAQPPISQKEKNDIYNINGEICGTRSKTFGSEKEKRIIGGKKSKTGEWPWAVSINSPDMKNEFPQSSWHTCGGSLINRQWVLTAVHCVANLVPGTENFGKLADVKSFTFTIGSNDAKYPRKHTASKFVLYPGDGNYGDMDKNDLALIKLEKPVDFCDDIRPVCLLDTNLPLDEYKKSTLTGWGLSSPTGDTDENRSSILHKIDIKLKPFSKCYDLHTDLPLTRGKNVLCGNSVTPMDALMFGDSGSPLVFDYKGKWTQVGIAWVSAGIEYPRHSSVGFVKVQYYFDWIKSVVALEEYNEND